jgi:Ca2+-binding EF-hand superfamily protein
MAGRLSWISLAFCAAALAACASHPRPPREDVQGFHPPVEILQRYDANRDGVLTRAEMEAGLKADFEAADTNHDGRLDADEAAAVNHQRWTENASTASTIVDWNHDGYVDFREFAGTARSLFDELDRDGDGTLSAKEWRPVKLSAKPDSENRGEDAEPDNQ